MVELWYSPLTPLEIQARLNSAISSVPRAADWEISPQNPDNFFFGEANGTGFRLSPASVHEKGHPTLELSGTIGASVGLGISHLTIRYRPGHVKLMMWASVFIFLLIWIALTLLHFSKTGILSVSIALPIFGLIWLVIFAVGYRKHVTNVSQFLQKLLLLQAEAI